MFRITAATIAANLSREVPLRYGSVSFFICEAMCISCPTVFRFHTVSTPPNIEYPVPASAPGINNQSHSFHVIVF